jgi:hypothetical protein
MKNAIIPASFLSVAVAKDKTMIRNGQHTYLIRETADHQFSHLYGLFFGEQSQTIKPDKELSSFTEPSEFSSYE